MVLVNHVAERCIEETSYFLLITDIKYFYEYKLFNKKKETTPLFINEYFCQISQAQNKTYVTACISNN